MELASVDRIAVCRTGLFLRWNCGAPYVALAVGMWCAREQNLAQTERQEKIIEADIIDSYEAKTGERGKLHPLIPYVAVHVTKNQI